ncbi:hypothetical protein D3C83_239800 [compost metagenome]
MPNRSKCVEALSNKPRAFQIESKYGSREANEFRTTAPVSGTSNAVFRFDASRARTRRTWCQRLSGIEAES